MEKNCNPEKGLIMSVKNHRKDAEDIVVWWLNQVNNVFLPRPRSVMPPDPVEVFRHPSYSYYVYQLEKGKKFDPTFREAAGSHGHAIIDVVDGIYSVGFRLKNASFKWERFWVAPVQRSMELTVVPHLGEKVIFLRFSKPDAENAQYFSFRFLSQRAECAFMQKLYMVVNQAQSKLQIKKEQPNVPIGYESGADLIKSDKPEESLRPAAVIKLTEDSANALFPTPGNSIHDYVNCFDPAEAFELPEVKFQNSGSEWSNQTKVYTLKEE